MSAGDISRGVYYGGEIRRFEGSSPDQATIDVGLPKQLGRVVGFDTTAIQDACAVSRHVAEGFTQATANEAMDFLSLFRGGNTSGADGPHGFVGDGDRFELLGCEPIQAAIELAYDDILDSPNLALLEGFSDADDRPKPCPQNGLV